MIVLALKITMKCDFIAKLLKPKRRNSTRIILVIFFTKFVLCKQKSSVVVPEVIELNFLIC